MRWRQQCPLCCWSGWPKACGVELLSLADPSPCAAAWLLDPTRGRRGRRGTILWSSNWHLNRMQSCAWGSLAVVSVVCSQNCVSHPRKWLPRLQCLFSDTPNVNKKGNHTLFFHLFCPELDQRSWGWGCSLHSFSQVLLAAACSCCRAVPQL